jgi:hypothetical protein
MFLPRVVIPWIISWKILISPPIFFLKYQLVLAAYTDQTITISVTYTRSIFPTRIITY